MWKHENNENNKGLFVEANHQLIIIFGLCFVGNSCYIVSCFCVVVSLMGRMFGCIFQ